METFLGHLNALAITSGLNPDNVQHLITAVATLVWGASLLRALGSADRTSVLVAGSGSGFPSRANT